MANPSVGGKGERRRKGASDLSTDPSRVEPNPAAVHGSNVLQVQCREPFDTTQNRETTAARKYSAGASDAR